MNDAKTTGAATTAATIAWLTAAFYYFYQYALRSAPAVMLPDLSRAFEMDAAGVASIVGVFYYGYAVFTLVAGVAMDRIGPRRVVPLGAALVGSGALLFATGDPPLAALGRLLQGAGGAFAIVGTIYIATTSFPPSRAGTLIGATQMFGMAGGSVGQFAVGPLIAAGFGWSRFWLAMGAVGLVLALPLYWLLPAPEKRPSTDQGGLGTAARAVGQVFASRQSILCGVIAGLLFMPTTIFDMIWGVRYLQEAIGHDYGAAVLRSATVPFGWIIGCPLLGWLSDRIGRRKPVLIGGSAVLLACVAWILFGPHDVLPPYLLGLVTGIASGAAMVPTTVIKESHPSELGGTATGVVTFLNFSFSALLGPVFARLLARAAEGSEALQRTHFQDAFTPLLYGVAVALVLACFLKETGSAATRRS